MGITLNKPSIGSTDWGTDVNDNWDTLEDAFNGIGYLLPAGTVLPRFGSSAPASGSGFIIPNPTGTIGDASSGATVRANSDCEALFALWWTDYTNTTLPIYDSAGGASTRGVSAAEDWAAHKRMSVPDCRGRSLVPLDNLGGTTASRITSGGSGITGTTLGSVGGTETHTLSTDELASHGHYGVAHRSSGGIYYIGGGFTAGANGEVGLCDNNYSNTPTNSSGSGYAHQNTQPSIMVGVIVALGSA